MNASHSLPVIIPNVADQRWSCHLCGECCRTLVIHLSDKERWQIDRHGWASRLGVAPYVRVGRGWALNKRADNACVFLDERNRCKIHSEYGEEAKPFACRIFPFSVRGVGQGWQASLRFDCPSVSSSKGKPVTEYRAWLAELVKWLDPSKPRGDGAANLGRGVRGTAEEIDLIISRFSGWLTNDELPMADRLIGAARITTTLAGAAFKKVRGPRFGELVDLLFRALPGECATMPAPPTGRQGGMLRQLAFAHAEHVTLREMRSGVTRHLRKRWRQLGGARQFLAGKGLVPRLPGFAGDATFDAVESVVPATDHTRDIEELLCRYLTARVEARSVFGGGYYGWPVFSGMAALWLAAAVVGWLARYAAAVDGRASISFEDATRALGMVDRAATRLPALGTMTERARISYLLKDDGVGRLLHGYSLTPVKHRW